MINETPPKKQPWQQELTTAFRSIEDLLAYCEVPVSDLENRILATQNLRFFVTKSWADRIEKGNVHDPLLRQVLPCQEELVHTPGYINDPLDENRQNPLPGLIHKYHGRVLVTITKQCAVYCRYCFRRAFPYEENRLMPENWQKIVQYIKARPDIFEVILSGGDPLILTDTHLEKRLNDLADIKHLRYLRIHSRIPVVLPSRMTTNLYHILQATRLKVALVIHSNCAQEIQTNVVEALKPAKAHGITLLNQSVLLKGVNDSPQALAALSHTLYDAGVMPYYLHKLDKITGSSHFALTEEEEQHIIHVLMRILPGFLMPKFVTEIPHAGAKIPAFNTKET